MLKEPIRIKQTVEIEKMLLKSRINKKLRQELSLLIASYRLLYNRATCESCDKPCMNNWCITNENNNCTDKSN